MSDLHGRIFNLPCTAPNAYGINERLAYKLGHRDARHAAAELANAKQQPIDCGEYACLPGICDKEQDVRDAERYRKWVSYSGFTKEKCDATLDAIQINEHAAKEPR
jgi:hypothetical protein